MAMFKGLLEPALENMNDIDMTGVLPDYEADAQIFQAMEDFHATKDDISSIESFIESMDNLEQLQYAVETYGISKSLVAFADKDLYLSTAISSFPSLESYTDDDSLKIAALEGVKEFVHGALKSFSTGIVNTFKRMGMALTSFFEGMMSKIKNSAMTMKNRVFSAEKLKSIKAGAGTLTKSAFDSTVTFLKTAGEKIKGIWSKKLPTSKEEYSAMETWSHEYTEYHGMGTANEALTNDDAPSLEAGGERTTLDKMGFNGKDAWKHVVVFLFFGPLGTLIYSLIKLSRVEAEEAKKKAMDAERIMEEANREGEHMVEENKATESAEEGKDMHEGGGKATWVRRGLALITSCARSFWKHVMKAIHSVWTTGKNVAEASTPKSGEAATT
jgi:hypothetical protein